jgi:hypothetical protein
LLLASVIFVTALVPIFGCPTGGQGQSNLTSRVETLEGQVAALNAKLANVRVVQGDINGLAGPHLIIEGCNLHVRDGDGPPDDDVIVLNGLGNLIVGYNELPPNLGQGRTGSHNVVIGSEHQYTSSGGLVAGRENNVTGVASSVTGGSRNTAASNFSSISGGSLNHTSGAHASVGGGTSNIAFGSFSSISGGRANGANGNYSSVSGGFGNTIFGESSSASGGKGNVVTGENASISGGAMNLAEGAESSVSGGSSRTVSNTDDWAAGALFQDN